jgi:hypothetical protein
MEYPLRWYHRLGREMLCTLLTHNWKSSWHRRPDFEWASEHYKELPYGRRNSGNGLYEYSETWEYKCRRCRLSVRHHQPVPLRHQLWYGLKQGIQTVPIVFQIHPWHHALLLAPVDAINYMFAHQDWMWPTIRFAPANLLYWLYGRLDKAEVHD